MKIEVSNGEILDKHTILLIKAEKLSDRNALENVKRELDTLSPAVLHITDQCSNPEVLQECISALTETNTKLWEVEDALREWERAKDFGEDFIALAREVYFTNDQRASIKKSINALTGSTLVEEKSYKDYR